MASTLILLCDSGIIPVNSLATWLMSGCASYSPHRRERVVAFLIEMQAAALPGTGTALTSVLGSMSNSGAALFDLPPQNMNRAGSALSIIYNHSFSISCLSARVAVTCPDSNGGRPGGSIYQCYREDFSSSLQSLSAFFGT